MNSGPAESEMLARGVHPAAGMRMDKEQPALHFLYGEIDALSYAPDKQATRAKLLAQRTSPVSTFAVLTTPCFASAVKKMPYSRRRPSRHSRLLFQALGSCVFRR